MKLEFELEEMNENGDLKGYNVLRKGLTVGLLILDGEEYQHPLAKCTKMEMK